MFEVSLAPMCGITDHIFRTICYEMGCDLAYTEMVSAMGYLCAPDQRVTQELLVRGKKEPRLILQLFGREPDVVAKAAKLLSDTGRFDGIDLNMGCPAKKIAPSGEGCGLMRTPAIAGEMIRKTVLASAVPVSVKMRLGYDSAHINVVEMAHIAEEEGAASVTVHGRTREQQYSGEADWQIIAEVKRHVNIPVIGNGDIFTSEQAVSRQAESGTDGVMIGRGAMGNPWIFRQVKERMTGHKPEPVTLNERHAMIIRHYEELLSSKPVAYAVREMRKHIGWYIKGLDGAASFRSAINQTEDPQTVIMLLDQLFDRQQKKFDGKEKEFL